MRKKIHKKQIPETHRVTVYLNPKTIQWAKETASNDRRSLSSYIQLRLEDLGADV